jgi:hypothetical protein
MFVGLVSASSTSTGWRQWAALMLCLILGIYTHFFGILLAGTLLVTLFVSRWRQQLSVRPVLIVGAGVALCALGLVPFINGAVERSLTGIPIIDERSRPREVVRLLYRLIGHPALATASPVAGVSLTVSLALVAAALLVLFGWFAARERRTCWCAVTAVLVLGLGVSIVANFALDTFSAAAVSYNIWALPFFFVALAGGLTSSTRLVRGGAAAATGVLLLCQAFGVAQLHRHGDYFAHGPHQHIQRLIDEAERTDTAVIHDGGSEAWVAIYFPLRYAEGPGFRQFVAVEGNDTVPLGVRLLLQNGNWKAELAPYRRLLVIRSRQQYTQNLVRQIRSGNRDLGSGPVARALEADPAHWRLATLERCVALVEADVAVFERKIE